MAAGVIKLVPLRTHLMVADALTKSCLPQHTSSTGTLCWATFLSPLLFALCATSSGGGVNDPSPPLSIYLFLSPPAVTGGAFPVVTGEVFSNMRGAKGAPYIFEG
jgi:hypothetical protein